MVIEVGADRFRKSLEKIVNRVQYRNDSIVISKDGKPVAALMAAEVFARIRHRREQFEALSARIADGYARASLDEGLEEIESAVRTGRQNSI